MSDDTIEAIVAGVQPRYPDLTFLIEDMDTKRHSLDELRQSLLTTYRRKYHDIKLSAVVTVDNNAFEFAIQHRESLFPGVPLIFCGLNGFQPSMLDGVKGVTGVTEAIDIDATVQMALAFHPNTTHLAVISDTTKSGRSMLEGFRKYAVQLPKSLQIVELAELTASELSLGLQRLPKDSVVLRFSFFCSADGRSFRVDQQAKLITQADLPVYDFWDEAIGSGYVGGYVVTGAAQGQPVIRILERILAGENPGQIKVVDRSPNVPVFDKRQLLRFGADMNLLPANAILRFDEVPFWQRHRRMLSGIGVTFLFLLGLAVFFAVLSVQRKKHAIALSLEEQKLRATLQSIGEGVVTTNNDGNVEHINSVAARLMGVTEQKSCGQPVAEIFQLTDSSTNAVIQSAGRGECPPTATGRLKTSAGKKLPIALTAAPISLPEGSESGTVIVFRDMTRENELQQELQQAQRLDALGQLAGGVAHDFNNMLGGIVGAAEILSLQLSDGELSEFPKLILSSADRAAELTAQLLSFAREQPVAKHSVHINQIIADTVGVLTRTIDPRIEIEIQGEAKMDMVQGDRTLLQSCLLNLGINASHAMPSGGKLIFATGEVCLKSSDCEASSFDLREGRYVEVRVMDTGTGIAPKIIKRIFDPFYTTKEQGKGTGLGLAAVFGTVQQHCGSVTVESELGQGTNFSIRLPLAESKVRHSKERNDGVINGNGMVLVVDDQAPLRDMAKKNLERLGYDVLTASDGIEAVEIFEREHKRIEVVLLDMIMPKMSGRDCFIELQRIDSDVRVISASGFSSPEDLQEMLSLGLTVHLTKPYRSAELSRAISKAVGKAVQVGPRVAG
ncbi:MAG: ATP-binding protein [Fuerstiella sp.]